MRILPSFITVQWISPQFQVLKVFFVRSIELILHTNVSAKANMVAVIMSAQASTLTYTVLQKITGNFNAEKNTLNMLNEAPGCGAMHLLTALNSLQADFFCLF